MAKEELNGATRCPRLRLTLPRQWHSLINLLPGGARLYCFVLQHPRSQVSSLASSPCSRALQTGIVWEEEHLLARQTSKMMDL